jgi:hypothetical protein
MTGWFYRHHRRPSRWCVFFFALLPGLFSGPVAAESSPANFGESIFLRLENDRSEDADDLFGGKWGFVHPFLSLGAEYTDNLFNTRQDRRADRTAIISPGIWLALPASREQLLDVTTMNSAPGGLGVSRFAAESEYRHQAYALYRADIKKPADHAEFDRTNHRAEGLLAYRLRGGLSLELLNIYCRDEDEFGTSALAVLDRYRSNLFNVRVGYDITPKTWVEFDYSNYSLNYEASRNLYRDRQDNAFSGSLFFRIFAKTALFVSADHINVRYDEDVLTDSTERNFYGGIQWRMTEHSLGRIKLGYGEKDYVGPLSEDRDSVRVEAQLQHWLTPKTTIGFVGSRKTNETTVQGPEGSLSHAADLIYRQRITRKLSGEASLGYTRDSFAGDFYADGEMGKRVDEYYRTQLKLGFDLKTWLNFAVEYAFERRDANFDRYDYRNNTIFLNVTFGI